MPRFSPPSDDTVPEATHNQDNLLPSHCVDADDDSGPSDTELEYSDDDEEEPPHPLGFPTSRYSTQDDDDDDDDETLEQYMRRTGFVRPFELSTTFASHAYQPPVTRYPPISSYVDARTVSTRSLLRSDRFHHHQSTTDIFDEMDQLSRLLQDAAVIVDSAPIPIPVSIEPFQGMQADEIKVAKEMAKVRSNYQRDLQDRMDAFKKLLSKQDAKADKMRKEQEALDEQYQKQVEDEEQFQLVRRKVDEQQKERDRLDRETRQAAAAERTAKEARQREDAARERDYVGRAQKLVAQLVQIRASVEPYEKSDKVKRQRLQMKKLVAGKINTLTESAEKVKSVATEVYQAISAAREEDERFKQLLAKGDPEVTPEMARGKRYLVDLLCSKVIVRVQAEGFNGQRGDGFPLAGMLALVSLENRDVAPVLAAHIYTVCPTAIPSLPDPAPNATEEELMESLGMQKKPDGSFETFERFLSRTESIISLVADIMASNPPTHSLLGGHESAIKWLSRFLALLPKAPETPLPLVTAPVLDAFLTGAGHMLANRHAEEFKHLLDGITNDIIKRLDEGSIGAPSATRLKKTVGSGFEGFKNHLPSRALWELYNGASDGGSHSHGSQSSAFVASTVPTNSNPFSSSSGSPFTANAAASPLGQVGQVFGSGVGVSTMAGTSPFGSTSTSGQPSAPFTASGTSSSSFGQSNTVQGNVAPFGQPSAPSSFSSASPFGQQSSTGISSSSPFGNQAAPSSAPWSAPSGTQTSSSQPALGGQMSSSPYSVSTFGSSPFGSGTGAPAPQIGGTTAFVSTSAATPFSTNASFGLAPTPTPFSQVGGSSNSTPFGAAASSSPFSQGLGQPANAMNSSPFGLPAAPSTSAFSSPFGPPPFGASSNPSPFGVAAKPFPFGSPSPTPFGQSSALSSNSSPSPFGSSAPFGQNPTGGGFGNAAGFGNSAGQSGNGRPPCKFFAQGRCKFGKECKFSHDMPPPGSNSFSNPFGGPRR